DHLMPSTCSLGREDVEERAPGGVHDALCEMMVLDHAVDREFLNSDMMIVFAVLRSHLIVEVPTLPLDLEMGLCGTLGSLTPSLRTLLPSRYDPLLASERLLALAVVAGILDGL